MHYSYDPLAIRKGGKDQMRFELGDTTVDGGEDSTALCDEEYLAILEDIPQWKEAKLEILSAILHKLSFQVDTKIDTLSYDFSTRVEQWQTMYDALKEEIEEEKIGNSAPSMAPMGKCHFYDGIHDNKGGWCP